MTEQSKTKQKRENKQEKKLWKLPTAKLLKGSEWQAVSTNDFIYSLVISEEEDMEESWGYIYNARGAFVYLFVRLYNLWEAAMLSGANNTMTKSVYPTTNDKEDTSFLKPN